MNSLIDGKDVVLRDADTVASNRYNVRLLGDTYNALNMTYMIMPIEHDMYPNRAPFTAILPGKCISVIAFTWYFISLDEYPRVCNRKFLPRFPVIYARKTLLPESPYRVVLQITDESLREGYGPNSVSQYRFYVVGTLCQTA